MSSVGTLVAASILASAAAACGSSTPAAALPAPDGGDAAIPLEAGEAAASADAGEAAAPIEAGEATDSAAVGDAGGTTQSPPMGAAAVQAWLATGVYKSWHCEAAPHAARSPSIHLFDRICSNDIISANATGTGPWPEGAAAVKELYTAATVDGGAPGAYAVYLKTEPDSGMGANWYFYGPLTAGGSAVDGLGSSATVAAECVSCHMAAGTDAAHTPSPGGRDEVYTPVP